MKRIHKRWVEWAAVLGCVAFGLAILFPAAGLARGWGKSEVCMTNLHILGRAWLEYPEDNDGKLVNGHTPRESTYAIEAFWKTTTSYGGPYKDNAWWVNPPHNASGVYTGDPIPCTLADEDNGIRSGRLYPYIGSSAAYHCPADRNYLRLTNRGGKRSYSIQGLMHGELPNATDSHNRRICADTLNQIVNPSAKFVFIENTDFRGWNMGSWIMNGGSNPPAWIDPFALFHPQRTGLTFADGHGEMHTWVDGSTIDMGTNQRVGLPINWGAGEGQDILYLAARYIPVY